MPFQEGNKLGGRPKTELSFKAMLERAIKQEDGQRVRKAAERLLDLAAEGEQWAVKELADRLDGKPKQVVAGPGPDGESKLVVEILRFGKD